MLLQRTLKLFLLGPLPALLLTACGQDRPAIALPPADRLEPVAFPVVPVGEAECDGAPCLSDRETGVLIADLAKALDQANARILWLKDWAKGMGR